MCAAVARRQPELGGRAEADPEDLLRPDAVRAAAGPHHQGHVRPVDGGPPHHHREGCSRSHSSGGGGLPVMMLQIHDVYPRSEFFHPGSRIQGQKDSGSA
jgi:hypothetical protein